MDANPLLPFVESDAQRLLLDFPTQVRAAILASTSSQVNEKAATYWEAQADEIE